MSIRQFTTTGEAVCICDAPAGSILSVNAIVTKGNKIGTIILDVSVLGKKAKFGPDRGFSAIDAGLSVVDGKLMASGEGVTWKVKYNQIVVQ